MPADSPHNARFLAFSTTRVYKRTADFTILAPDHNRIEDNGRLNALYEATAEATQAAIYDALFKARTMTGFNGITFYALPHADVLDLLRRMAR